MQNKQHFFFLVLGVPTFGPNSQIFPKIRFEGFPNTNLAQIFQNVPPWHRFSCCSAPVPWQQHDPSVPKNVLMAKLSNNKC